MKRILTILFLCAAILLLPACGQQKPVAENITFTCVIEEIHDKSMLVSTTDEVGFDKADVSYGDGLKAGFNVLVGQTVRLTILPDIAESYPVQVTAVSIELVSEPTDDTLTAENTQTQLQLIAKEVAQWSLASDYANEAYHYAVTDLDSNGRLELIAANTGGTGYYTYSNFYEVNEDLTALVMCDRGMDEGDSQADIASSQTAPGYYDAASDTLYCIFHDDMKNGAAEYYQGLRAISLKNGAVQETQLAQMATIYDGETPTTTYYDSQDASITEEAYNQYAETTYSELEKKTVTIAWYTQLSADQNPSSMEPDALLSMLTDSFAGFQVAAS